MTFLDSFFSAITIPTPDLIALCWFIFCFVGYDIYAERNRSTHLSILTIMNNYRFQWMRQMLKRDNRMFDAAIIGNLMHSISFLASTSILIVAGLVTVIGYREQAVALLSDLPFAVQSSPMLWDIKILLMIMIFTYAFFKFTWSLRTHNYTSIMVAAAPHYDEQRDKHEEYALKSGHLAINASKHYNRGLRAYYFGLAALCWFVHPLLLFLSSTLVVWVIYRREFRSNALAGLLGHTPDG